MNWHEGKVARILARNTFADCLCALENCTWTGSEVDLLVVTRNRRVIDVEVKVSRADLKADKHKGKWWHQPYGNWVDGKWAQPARVARQWPRNTWKHYYAMPAEVWVDTLLEHVQPASGVLLVEEGKQAHGNVRCVKRAKPCKDNTPITDDQVIAVARLASLRMWDAIAAADSANKAREAMEATAEPQPVGRT